MRNTDTDPTSIANAELEVISRFCTHLALRPDGDQVRAELAAAFVDHHADLWPLGDPNATLEYIQAYVDEILAVIERLWGEAACGPMAHAFLDRMAWLPRLLAALDVSEARLDA